MNITHDPACNCGGTIAHMAVVIEDQAARIAQLEAENAKLRRQVELADSRHGSIGMVMSGEFNTWVLQCGYCGACSNPDIDPPSVNHHPDCPHAEASK